MESYKAILKQIPKLETDNTWTEEFRQKMLVRQKAWTDDKAETHQKFLFDLVAAYNALKADILTNIINTLRERVTQNPNVRLITIKNWDQVKDYDAWKQSHGFHPNNLTKGFWDSKTSQYKRFTHIEAGIDNTMEEDIFAELAPHGFLTYLVDDTNQSGKTVMKVKLFKSAIV